MDYRSYRPILNLGSSLYRWRRFFYAIPIVLLVLSAEDLRYPFGSYLWDETLEFLSFCIVCIGIALRFWAGGSARRSMVKKGTKTHFRFETKGIFSLIRNPYFTGDFTIIIGLSLLLFHPLLIASSLSFFLLLYQPILFGREELLVLKFGRKYQIYSEKTPLFLPSFRHWKRKIGRFRWILAFEKEGSLMSALGFLFIFMEQIREFTIRGHWNANPLWIVIAIPFLFLSLIIKSFDNNAGEYVNLPTDWPE